MKTQRHYLALVTLNLLLIGAVALFASGSITRARGLLVQTTPQTITYQGMLSDGGAGADGWYNLTFQIYAAETGGLPLWQESHSGVTVDNGAFAVVLGYDTPFPSDLFHLPERWMEIHVDGAPLTPRQQFASVPYALNADTVDGLDASELGGGLPAGAVVSFPYGSAPTGFTAKPDALGQDVGPWTPIAEPPAPTTSCWEPLWTGSKFICWYAPGFGGQSGAVYDPVGDSWSSMSVTNAPTATGQLIWTGSEMLAWGGAFGKPLQSGARYDPATNSWTPMSTANAPSARNEPYMVWTGSYLLVWGGSDPTTYDELHDGALYSPGSDSWTTISTTGAPSVDDAVVEWINGRLVVWGGRDTSTGPYYNTGAVYYPSANSWSAMSTTNAPTRCDSRAAALNAGTRLIVWGGSVPNGSDCDGTNTGATYSPQTNSWNTMSTPATSYGSHKFWTGSEMAVRGAYHLGLYNPTTNVWRRIPYHLGYVSEETDWKKMAVAGDYLFTGGGIFDLAAGRWISSEALGFKDTRTPAVAGGEIFWLPRLRHTIEIVYPYVKE